MNEFNAIVDHFLNSDFDYIYKNDLLNAIEKNSL